MLWFAPNTLANLFLAVKFFGYNAFLRDCGSIQTNTHRIPKIHPQKVLNHTILVSIFQGLLNFTFGISSFIGFTLIM